MKRPDTNGANLVEGDWESLAEKHLPEGCDQPVWFVPICYMLARLMTRVVLGGSRLGLARPFFCLFEFCDRQLDHQMERSRLFSTLSFN